MAGGEGMVECDIARLGQKGWRRFVEVLQTELAAVPKGGDNL